VQSANIIHIVGCHAEGEVGDVITGGVAPPPGETVWEQSRWIAKDDRLRQLVLNEPRGGLFRHVNLLVPPKHPDADAAFIIMEPEDTPPINQYEVAHAGANGFLVNGLITDCGKIVRDGAGPMGWFDMSTLKEPYRLEGKKTMGLEIAEQFGWRLPDVILYPTGGGTGLIGMWKAFSELVELGWLETADMPRMVAVQSQGCCPIVRAYERGERFAEVFEGACTIASGLRVPAAVGDFMILDALAESGGCAVAVDEASIRGWMDEAARAEGIALGPESACCVGAARCLRDSGWLEPDARVVIFNCGGARKYPDLMAHRLPSLDRFAGIDWKDLPALAARA